MITYNLTTDELSNLLVDNLYDDGKVVLVEEDSPTVLSLTSESTMTHAYIWTVSDNLIVVPMDRYNRLMSGAMANGYTPVFIIGTPDGIYEFNMDIMSLNVELHTDEDRGDAYYGELSISKGKRILDFYPDFSSEDEYIDALMSNGDVIGFDDSL